MPKKPAASVRLSYLKVENYRGIPSLEIAFHPTEPTVLIGKNGSGKSSLLECLAVMFSQLIQTSSEQVVRSERRQFEDADISNGEAGLAVTATLRVLDHAVPFALSLERNANELGPKQSSRAVQQALERLWSRRALEDRLGQPLNQQSLPLFVLYPVSRTVVDIPGQSPKQAPFAVDDAYAGALTGGKLNFSAFFEWFIARENYENSIRRHRQRDYEDKELTTVRKAIGQLTGFEKLYVDQTQQPFKLMLQKSGLGGAQELAVNQLSDGERMMLAMTGDLARRLATAYPEHKQPLVAPGIVLIDELELHLHPEWQARLLLDLGKTFPGCQFVVSTHSPVVVSRVPCEAICMLERTAHGVELCHPRGSLGYDVSTILEAFMGSPAREEGIERELQKLTQLIDAGELTKAKALHKKIAIRVGQELPELAKAAVQIQKRRLLGL